MSILPVAQGVWLGFSIAAPVGPIGTLVLKQSLRSGFRAGIVSGLGAALADLCYGSLAAAGVRMAAAYAHPIAFVGGIILLWLAWKAWHEASPQEAAVAESESKLRRIGTTFLLTISNPMTILSFAAMISAVGAADPAQFVAGVFLGSMLWWTVLSATSSCIAKRVEIRSSILNRAAAITLAGFGLWGVLVKGLR
jgi:putative LysE/RhtB family amino acid efflux pump